MFDEICEKTKINILKLKKSVVSQIYPVITNLNVTETKIKNKIIINLLFFLTVFQIKFLICLTDKIPV